MFVLKPTSNVRAKQDVGTDVTFHISGYDVDDVTGLGVPFNEAGTLDATGAALVVTPAAARSKTVMSIVLNVTGTTQRLVTLYLPEDGTTQTLATRWGGPFNLLADETAEYDGTWTVYDSNHVAKYSSATSPRLIEGADPPTPPAGSSVLFAGPDGRVRQKDDAGMVAVLPSDDSTGNVLINGEFDYAQRQAPGTLTTYSSLTGRVYAADRWAVTNENASAQYQRADTAGAAEVGLASRFYGNWSKITALGKLMVTQTVESGACLHLRGRQVRLQLRLKSDAARTVRVLLLQLAAAGTIDAPPAAFISAFGANTVDPTFGTAVAKIAAPVFPDNATVRLDGLDCAVTTVWQRFGGVWTLPTDFKNLIVAVVSDSQVAIAGIVRMSEVGLFDGPEIRNWTPKPQSQQLLNCLRYYCKSFPIDSAPIQNFTIALGGHQKLSCGVAGATSTAHGGVRYPVPMFKAPTVTHFNPAAANAFVRNTRLATDSTATSATSVTQMGHDVTALGPAGWAAGNDLAVHFTADAEI